MIVDIDFGRKPQVMVTSALKRDGDDGEEFIPAPRGNIIKDMATLCEGLCTLIHSANKSGVQKDYESLASCIKHLESGFSDPNYKTMIIDKDGKLKERENNE